MRFWARLLLDLSKQSIPGREKKKVDVQFSLPPSSLLHPFLLSLPTPLVTAPSPKAQTCPFSAFLFHTCPFSAFLFHSLRIFFHFAGAPGKKRRRRRQREIILRPPWSHVFLLSHPPSLEHHDRGSKEMTRPYSASSLPTALPNLLVRVKRRRIRRCCRRLSLPSSILRVRNTNSCSSVILTSYWINHILALSGPRRRVSSAIIHSRYPHRDLEEGVEEDGGKEGQCKQQILKR